MTTYACEPKVAEHRLCFGIQCECVCHNEAVRHAIAWLCEGYVPDASKEGAVCIRCGLDITVYTHRPTSQKGLTAKHPGDVEFLGAGS